MTRAQRGIKEKAALLEWAGRCVQWPTVKDDVEEHLTLLTDDQYMGCWVNRRDRALILWLLEEQIPCFIIHFLTPTELRSFFHMDVDFFSGFLVGMEAESLGEEQNSYELVRRRN